MTMKMLSSIIFFLFNIPHAFSISFNFSSFSPNDRNISYEGSSYPAPPSIQLTRNQQDQSLTASVGRATYYQPMRLWDKATGNLTDFRTHFTFVIRSKQKAYGDGLAFFLAPAGSKLPNVTKGGSMGLTLDDQPLNSTDNPFVAVEFDIYKNYWDPPKEHVGVNINSMRSVNNLTWLADINGGRTNEVFISYNSNTQNLSIVFTGFVNGTIVQQHLYQIVDMRKYLPEWVAFGFSAATGSTSAIHKINSWSFLSNNDDLNAPNEFSETPFNPSTSPSPSQSPKSRNNRTKLGVGLGVGGFILICVFSLAFVGLKKKKRKMEEDDHEFDEQMYDSFGRGIGPKEYSYADLASATNYFEDAQKLGQGGFGEVYRGFLKDSNTCIAIKRISEGSKQGMKEFASEVRIISQLRHRNLVQLLGWCHKGKELLLVYEYMPNGSLDFHLFKDQSLLKWSERFKIAQGLASALLYLHEGWERCVVHRDIKSSNIMLDSNFNAKLGDFGLARLVDHAKSSPTTALAGTMGYMAPECLFIGRASKESDMYSLGIVALETACGRKCINHNVPENEINIVNWVWELYGSGRILEAVDPRLQGDFDHDQIKCLMIVGLWCAHPDHNHRPSIRQAMNVLNFEVPFPSLPLSYPELTYHELPPVGSSSSIPSTTNASKVSQN
ncbi:L-type lectin-domain containing receptor kinase IX.1-like [Neltuma alba]|uniref:L-type lectin-domain containing receptor kinase IX.1-like n=1 Tax=Neltuma alba TaxID=207710 RepID=UPI0010A32568|nr:L-type lectin-domain containing receptor kinase IX.1-like [Prosopis alba]